MVFAPPAASAPPNTTAAINPIGGTPCLARNIGGTAVMSSSSITRGFVRRTYAPTVENRGRGGASSGSVDGSISGDESTGRTCESADHDLADHPRGRMAVEGTLEVVGAGFERHRSGRILVRRRDPDLELLRGDRERMLQAALFVQGDRERTR